MGTFIVLRFHLDLLLICWNCKIKNQSENYVGIHMAIEICCDHHFSKITRIGNAPCSGSVCFVFFQYMHHIVWALFGTEALRCIPHVAVHILIGAIPTKPNKMCNNCGKTPKKFIMNGSSKATIFCRKKKQDRSSQNEGKEKKRLKL